MVLLFAKKKSFMMGSQSAGTKKDAYAPMCLLITYAAGIETTWPYKPNVASVPFDTSDNACPEIS